MTSADEDKTEEAQQAAEQAPQQTPRAVHHTPLSEEPALPPLSDEDEPKREEDETFHPGPLFGSGL